MIKWNFIETAPKDGTEILIYSGKNYEVVRWHNDRWITNNHSHYFVEEFISCWTSLPDKSIINKFSRKSG